MSRAHLREKLVQGSAESPDSSVILRGGEGRGWCLPIQGCADCLHTHTLKMHAHVCACEGAYTASQAGCCTSPDRRPTGSSYRKR